MRTLPHVLMTVLLASGCSTALVDHDAASPRGALPLRGTMIADAACVVAGQPRTIAPAARIQAGVDVARSDNAFLLGFSPKLNERSELELDPASGAITHLTPTGSDRSANMDTDAPSNRLTNVRSLEPAFVIGTTDGKLSSAPSASSTPQTLWPLPADSIRDLQGVALDGAAGFAVLFRADNALWLGTLGSDRKPTGPLAKIVERPALRWPTLAASDGAVLIVWAEQAHESSTWSLAGLNLADPKRPLSLSEAIHEVESDALQPMLAGIGGKRFLLSFTTGDSDSHRVRAVTIDENARALGPTMAISGSTEGGWAHPAVTADGRGTVLFFTPTSEGFAMAATPIACSAPGAEVRGLVATRR